VGLVFCSGGEEGAQLAHLLGRCFGEALLSALLFEGPEFGGGGEFDGFVGDFEVGADAC
jgi:hypothetical protein